MAIERTERIRQDLERVVSDETATFVMDRPPGGWSELVTRDVLDDKVEVLRQEMRAIRHELMAEIGTSRNEIGSLRHELHGEIGSLRHELRAEIERSARIQTWRLISVLVAITAVLGVLGRF